MKQALKCMALFAVCYLLSAGVIAILELITTSAVDWEKVLTVCIGPTLCCGGFYFVRTLKKKPEKEDKK